MKVNQIIYYIATGLLSLLMLFSAGMYFSKYSEVTSMFTSFGYPTYIIYPLAVAKILGLIAIWQKNFKSLKEWAYAGFFFDLILAFFAHFMIKDGGQNGALIGIILLIVSYLMYKKLNK